MLCCRVIVGATYKEKINLQLHLFNNCFEDKFSDRKFFHTIVVIIGSLILTLTCDPCTSDHYKNL